jgi:hypothetical protein
MISVVVKWSTLKFELLNKNLNIRQLYMKIKEKSILKQDKITEIFQSRLFFNILVLISSYLLYHH